MKSELKTLVLGSRGSKLALWQTEFVRAELQRQHPDIQIEIKIIKTTGDKILDVPLAQIGDKGLFTREIEEALLAGEVDAAVHSLKDLPVDMPEGLALGAVLKRENPSDVFISGTSTSLKELPANATIGTSSLRRIAQLKSFRPDLNCYELRGNVETRLRKMGELGLDGIILAYAGVKRLGLDAVITEIVDHHIILPAVGQGAIALEIRAGDLQVGPLMESIGDAQTRAEVAAERSLLKTLGGGCQVPIGAHAVCQKEEIVLSAIVANLDGTMVIRGEKTGLFQEAEGIGISLARKLAMMGAADIVKSLH